MILHDQSLLPTAPSVPVGTTWTITEDTTWEVLATGDYQVELHGGGGGGLLLVSPVGQGTNRIAASGGGSGEIYSLSLTLGERVSIVIGKGGSSLSIGVPNDETGSAGSGEATTFGNVSVPGGGGGSYSNWGKAVAGGSAAGSLASPGTVMFGAGTAAGGSGGSQNETQSYGNGGTSKASTSGGSSANGQPGAAIVTYLG